MPLEKLDVTRPQQLLLFTSNDLKPEYTNTLALYDAIPKYVYHGKVVTNAADAEVVKRDFEYEGAKLTATLTPAMIEGEDGKHKFCFAGEREEIVEEALRKIALNGGAVYIDGQCGVVFTGYELRKELKRMKHTYSDAQINEALEIGHLANSRVENEAGEIILDRMSSSIFPLLRARTVNGKKTGYYVTFHPWVTRGIQRGDYRQISYETLMDLRSPLARWFFKRFINRWRYASVSSDNDYSIDHERVMTESGSHRLKQLRDEIIKVERVLQGLKDKNLIADFEIKKKYEGKRGNQITGAVYHLVANYELQREVKRANALQSDAQSILGYLEAGKELPKEYAQRLS